MRPSLLWILAVVLTLFSAYWQRRTGPTHPVSGTTAVAGHSVRWTLERTHKGDTGHEVSVTAPNAVAGSLEWRRHRTGDAWTTVPMQRRGGTLVAMLPPQPPAAKLAYRVTVEAGGQRVAIPERETVVIRYTGEVPPFIMIPHILLMIGSMLVSARAGLECFAKAPRLRVFTLWTLGILFVGGMVFGPLVLKYAFGFWWSGWPLGNDITDNKTLIALAGWLVATLAVFRARNAKPWVLAAAVVMFVVFMIPHSLGGTELDWSKVDAHNAGAPALP
jgi:hypothetical protein